MDTRERNRLKGELAQLGIKGDYLSTWQAKGDTWLHVDRLTVGGGVWKQAGSLIPNQNTHMEHLLRRALKGVLPFKPSRDCLCKGCRERDWDRVRIDQEGQIWPIEDESVQETNAFSNPAEESVQVVAVPVVHKSNNKSVYACPDCDFKAREGSKHPKRNFNIHRRQNHKDLVAA